MVRSNLKISAFLMLLIVGLGGFYWLNQGHADNEPTLKIPKELTSYRDVVKQVLPAVVSIRSTVTTNLPARGQGPMPDLRQFNIPDNMRDQIEEFFQHQMPDTPRMTMPFGSGVIIDPKGVIVTNHHVVANATSVQVTLHDGRVFTSKDIASDPKVDLAVIKLDVKESLPSLPFGNSDTMEIGDRVLAVGAPFGMEGSVTHGIISGKRRHMGMLLYEDFLQTDAPINPGNSGGPLVNLAGEIVGINTAIRTTNGASQGVGLVIPSNLAKDVTSQLATKGNVTRGYLGIRFGELAPDIAAKMGLTNGKGAVVGQVYPNTPASKAGLQEGDVITAINGQPLKDANTVQRTVLSTPIGKSVDLTILRNGQTKTLTVKIEQQPEEYGLRDDHSMMQRRSPGRSGEREEKVRLEKLGLEVMELTAELRERMGYAPDVKGVVIAQVDRGSMAMMAGLRRGQLIVSVNQQPVLSLADIQKAADTASLKEGVMLLIKSPAGTDYVMLKTQN